MAVSSPYHVPTGGLRRGEINLLVQICQKQVAVDRLEVNRIFQAGSCDVIPTAVGLAGEAFHTDPLRGNHHVFLKRFQSAILFEQYRPLESLKEYMMISSQPG